MKRSGGLIAVSIFLIVAGVLGAWAALVPALAGPTLINPQQTDAQWTAFSSAAAQRAPLTPEQTEKLRALFTQMLAQMRDFLTRPSVRVSYGLAGLVALAACVAGIGMLLGKGWARTLAIGQAVASIPLTVWSVALASSFQQQLATTVSGVISDPRVQQQMHQLAQSARTAGLGLNIALVVAWNAFLICFLNRASVKAQFQARSAGP